jgi:hypothetical protein
VVKEELVLSTMGCQLIIYIHLQQTLMGMYQGRKFRQQVRDRSKFGAVPTQNMPHNFSSLSIDLAVAIAVN